MDRKLIGRCGKFCGECRLYLVAHNGDAAARAELARELGIETARLRCEGCQGPAEACFNVGCKAVACLNEKGLRYCVQCAEINDCTKYARLNAEAGGKPKVYATQLKSWGEERWLKYHLEGEKKSD